jgi:hypothetical protein
MKSGKYGFMLSYDTSMYYVKNVDEYYFIPNREIPEFDQLKNEAANYCLKLDHGRGEADEVRKAMARLQVANTNIGDNGLPKFMVGRYFELGLDKYSFYAEKAFSYDVEYVFSTLMNVISCICYNNSYDAEVVNADSMNDAVLIVKEIKRSFWGGETVSDVFIQPVASIIGYVAWRNGIKFKLRNAGIKGFGKGFNSYDYEDLIREFTSR